MSGERIFGIDLGTTNSEIAYLENGRPVLVPLPDGELYLPSAVGVDREGKIVTGFAARNQYAAFPEDTVVSIKRKMGSGETVSMAGKTFTPAEISSHILAALKEAAERKTGAPVRKAVISVPAHFTDLQRRDTIRAGELAGLEVVRIINEPTAAALAYGCRENVGEKVLVYDLGGGTFDISLMHIEDDVLEVMATDGDAFLGGDDFDALLAERLIDSMPEGSVGPEDRRARARLRTAAERTKIALSTETVRQVREEFVATRGGRPVHLDTVVDRLGFEELIGEKLAETFQLVDRVLAAAKVKESDIAKVLLVGGSTRIPRIFDVLATERGFAVHRGVDPMFAVAIGAAVQGAIVAGDPIPTVLVDVNAHSLGILAVGIAPDGEPDFDGYSVIIHRNTPIPSSMGRTYYTMVEDQEKVRIETFQGEKAAASANTAVGSFVLDLPGKLPAQSEIDVTFAYDLNGIVEVSARDRTSGRESKARYDVNRLTEAGIGTEARAAEAGTDGEGAERFDRRKCERILKSARRKANRIGVDPALAARIAQKAAVLEKAILTGGGEAGKLAEELAEAIVGI